MVDISTFGRVKARAATTCCTPPARWCIAAWGCGRLRPLDKRTGFVPEVLDGMEHLSLNLLLLITLGVSLAMNCGDMAIAVSTNRILGLVGPRFGIDHRRSSAKTVKSWACRSRFRLDWGPES